MREDTWSALEIMFAKYPILQAGEISYDRIDTTAEQIGFPIDKDYREFIHRFGGAIVGAYRIYGLKRPPAMGSQEPLFLDLTRDFRKDNWAGTDRWLVFSMDHCGNPIGIARDGSIWISDHDNGQIDVVASNFEQFLRSWCLKINEPT